MVCETCGTTHQDFKKGGRLAVKPAITVPTRSGSTVDGMHVESNTGEIPGSKSRVDFDQSIELIRKELQEAVGERISKAAELRDRLHDMENDAKTMA